MLEEGRYSELTVRESSLVTCHPGLWRSLTGSRWYGFLVLVLGVVAFLLMIQPFFQHAGLRWMHILFSSFLLGFLLTPITQKAAFHWEILDRPGGHKIHQSPTPLLGGIPVFWGFFLPLLFNGIFSTELVVIVLSSLVLFILGVIDDARSLPASLRFGVQIALAFIVACYGVRIILFADQELLGRAGNVLLSVIWIVGITNAMNFLDGMDGLAAGLGAIISFFMGIVALRMDVPLVGWACLAMLGACLGFLPFNFKPGKRASIFLGDAGSTVIGYTLAVLAIYSDWADLNSVISLISPLLIFGILIFDMCYITFFRIFLGQVTTFREWIEYVGHDHLHHRFAKVLGGRTESVLFIYALSICLGMSALLLPHVEPGDTFLILGQSVLILVMVSILERKYRADLHKEEVSRSDSSEKKVPDA